MSSWDPPWAASSMLTSRVRQTGKRAIFHRARGQCDDLKRFAIQPGEKCIIAEDVVTTGILLPETKRDRRGWRHLPGHHLRGDRTASEAPFPSWPCP